MVAGGVVAGDVVAGGAVAAGAVVRAAAGAGEYTRVPSADASVVCDCWVGVAVGVVGAAG